MGLFNMLWVEMKCPQCGKTSEISWDFKGYGERGVLGYRLGSKISPDIPRDRKLRYVDLGGNGECANCSFAMCGSILIVRKEILESLYKLPIFSDVPERGLFANFKRWELMLLTQEYSLQDLERANERVAYKLGGADCRTRWSESIARTGGEMLRANYGRLYAVEAQLKNESEAARFPAKEPYREALLSALAGADDFLSTKPLNIVDHPHPCPGCGEINDAPIPFPYGRCNGYIYKLASIIDWTRPGYVPQIHDRELRYIEISIPVCVRCGHSARGMVTVEKEHVIDIFVWPKILWGINSSPS